MTFSQILFAVSLSKAPFVVSLLTQSFHCKPVRWVAISIRNKMLFYRLTTTAPYERTCIFNPRSRRIAWPRCVVEVYIAKYPTAHPHPRRYADVPAWASSG